MKEAYGERKDMCVVSNRNASIIKAVSDVYNKAPHYACVFDTMAKSYSKTEFHKLMKKVEAVHARLKNYLELTARELPIYDFLEEVRLMFGRSNCENRHQALYIFTDPVGKFQEILQQNEAECTRMKVIPASEYIYTVHNKEKYFIVCLKEKKSSCNAFQLDEIPCVHACEVLDSKNFKKGPYCSDLYKSKTVLRTYDLPVYPLPHSDNWVIPKEIMDELS
ncbi:uncharacterized protein LOC107863084 [Capsicum annuum]|uniref:uncharacterized protein LOC107863084 n=1 Tax=Capsicum annuum TaxID=4072 RepID=UPI001FB15B63|nr:uncharacterized protein LOC107863084 [Capsicum annuum]